MIEGNSTANLQPSILPVTPPDAPIIATLAETIWRRHYVNIISAAQIDYMLQQRYRPELIGQQLQNPDIWWRKLTLNDVIIGFSCCMRTQNPGELKIDKLYIHPDHHRKGYGALLIADAIQIVRENNLQSLILTVNKNNRSAISAYRHYGFAITGDSIVDIGNGFVMNDYLMTLEKLNRVADCSMKLKFTKMQGLGNDFVVLDGINQAITLDPQQIRKLADRHFGIGCDQILLVEKAEGQADFRYRIFNADGGEVEQCGNGARCFVRYVHDHGLTQKNEIRIETLSGIISPKLEINGNVTVNMGKPIFEPDQIPFVADKRAPTYQLELQDQSVTISALSMGNPHAVRVVPDVDYAPVDTEGAVIESHPRFPKRVNVGYLQVIDRGHIKLRVFERGAGETLACGTGACAAVVAGISLGLLDHQVNVSTRGGELTINWQGNDEAVWMTGPAVTVFEGEINL